MCLKPYKLSYTFSWFVYFLNSPLSSLQEREHVLEQQTVLRQLETILSIHKLYRLSHHLDALREVAKLPFLPLDPRAPDVTNDVFQNSSPHVQACVPDLLKVALHCLDNVTDIDGSLRALRTKVCLLILNLDLFIFIFTIWSCCWS